MRREHDVTCSLSISALGFQPHLHFIYHPSKQICVSAAGWHEKLMPPCQAELIRVTVQKGNNKGTTHVVLLNNHCHVPRMPSKPACRTNGASAADPPCRLRAEGLSSVRSRQAMSECADLPPRPCGSRNGCGWSCGASWPIFAEPSWAIGEGRQPPRVLIRLRWRCSQAAPV